MLAAWVRVLPLRPPLSTALLFQRVGGARCGKPGACGLSTAAAAAHLLLHIARSAPQMAWTARRLGQAAGGALGQITRGEEPPLAELALGVPLGRAFFFFLALSLCIAPARLSLGCAWPLIVILHEGYPACARSLAQFAEGTKHVREGKENLRYHIWCSGDKIFSESRQ